MNVQLSTVSGPSEVRRWEIVIPAALKVSSPDALDAGIQSRRRATFAILGRCGC